MQYLDSNDLQCVGKNFHNDQFVKTVWQWIPYCCCYITDHMCSYSRYRHAVSDRQISSGDIHRGEKSHSSECKTWKRKQKSGELETQRKLYIHKHQNERFCSINRCGAVVVSKKVPKHITLNYIKIEYLFGIVSVYHEYGWLNGVTVIIANLPTHFYVYCQAFYDDYKNAARKIPFTVQSRVNR